MTGTCMTCKQQAELVPLPKVDEVFSLLGIASAPNGICQPCLDQHDQLDGSTVTLGYTDGTQEDVTLRSGFKPRDLM